VSGAAVAACGPVQTEGVVRRLGAPVHGRTGTRPDPKSGRGPMVTGSGRGPTVTVFPAPPGLITAPTPCGGPGRVPVVDRAVSTPTPALPRDRGPGAAAPNRVLVVDDDPALEVLLQHTIARCGYQVSVTPDPIDALTQLQTRPDVLAVSSALRTPTMTGVEFGIHLSHLSGVPVLLLMSDPAPMGLLDNPLLGVINKPMRMADLRDRLEELRTRRTTAATRAGLPDEATAAGGVGELPNRPHRL